jgi:hypothetical protein
MSKFTRLNQQIQYSIKKNTNNKNNKNNKNDKNDTNNTNNNKSKCNFNPFLLFKPNPHIIRHK